MRSLRRSVMFAVSVSLLVALPGVGPAGNAATTPRGTAAWPQARFSPVHHGINPFETILSPSTVGGLHQIWAIQLTGKVLYAAPTVVDGVVYLGTSDGMLSAFDAATSALVWSTLVDGALEDVPAVVNGIVYVHSDAGTVYALNASTGTVVWTATVGSAVAPVTVTNGVVYACGFDQLFALDADTGAQLWTAQLRGSARSAPTVAGGRVFVAIGGVVQANSATTGAELWVRRPGSGDGFQASTPTAASGSVFVGSLRGAVYAFDARTGAVRWTAKLDLAMDSSPAIANGVVYIGGGTNTYALDSGTGAVLWTTQHVTASGLGVTFADGVVYAASDGLYALDAGTGSILWSEPFGPRFSTSSPVVVNGMVFVASDNLLGVLYAFGL
jgi:outer membrane protein assembly factor BamB